MTHDQLYASLDGKHFAMSVWKPHDKKKSYFTSVGFEMGYAREIDYYMMGVEAGKHSDREYYGYIKSPTATCKSKGPTIDVSAHFKAMFGEVKK